MYQAIINFWFKTLTPEQWWKKDPELDQLITEKFKDMHHRATRGELSIWRDSARGRLAEIILLDQFSRNMYRDSAEAFRYDGMALVLAQEAIAQGAEQALSAVERSFLYLPFMHSESAQIHEVAVALYEKNGLKDNLDFELQHQAIIQRFGRYPHRNKLLGRVSTAAEIAFLQTPDSSF